MWPYVCIAGLAVTAVDITVRRHVSNISDKTGMANRPQAAVYAKERGLG